MHFIHKHLIKFVVYQVFFFVVIFTIPFHGHGQYCLGSCGDGAPTKVLIIIVYLLGLVIDPMVYPDIF